MEKEIESELSERFVHGNGPDNAEVMIIGEAPGAQEDQELSPFVGRAGKLLDKTLATVGLPRETVYVTNVVKSRPPNNRRPTDQEIHEHLPFLIEEHNRIKPKYVLLLGNTALSVTTRRNGIMRNRGVIPKELSAFPDRVITFATLHPSAALRSTNSYNKFLEDLQQFAEIVQHGRTHGSALATIN